MAKRKPNQPQLSVDLVRNIGITLIVLIALFFLVRGGLSYVSRSDFFTVRDIVVAENLGTLDIPELSRLKGQNIFLLRIDKFESRIHSKYPALSNVKVVRRFPNQVLVTAVKRQPFAKAVLNGRIFLIDRDGCLIGLSNGEKSDLVVVKGLKSAKALLGEVVEDVRFAVAGEVISAFLSERKLEARPLQSVDMTDPARIVCVVGDEDSGTIDVIVDSKSFPGRVGTLATILSQGKMDLAEVKYIDLRFEAPIIGQKKQKKL